MANRRDHGGLIFIDLRDRYGRTQVVFNPERDQAIHSEAEKLRSEDVVAVRGTVCERPEGTVNPSLPTGEVEIIASLLEILNRSETPPFDVSEHAEVSEETRLRYRYLDLRRPTAQQALIRRAAACQKIREFLAGRDFVEVETPFLTKSTPEGARDFLVPSRLNQGHFYALPQSPQLFKQILMVSGFDKYFQIVRCFRDEDLRADRQPEFTQLDVEMSFVEESDVIDMTEGVLDHVVREVFGIPLDRPFPRMTYGDAVRLYGTDKPDLRFGMLLYDATSVFSGSEAEIFRSAIASGAEAIGLTATGGSRLSRKDRDELAALAQSMGAGGVAWFEVAGRELKSPLAKFFSEDLKEKLLESSNGKPGDLLLFVVDKRQTALSTMGAIRLATARRLGLIRERDFRLCWVLDFPLFEIEKETGRIVSSHHPFTAPKEDSLGSLEERPLEVLARAYDVVLNGTEIGSGSIRIHRPELQQRVFRILQIGEAEAAEKFGFLLEALSFGAPPHGGIALGLDRLIMLLLGLETIRDVIAFPKTQKGACLMSGAPGQVSPAQLRELGIASQGNPDRG